MTTQHPAVRHPYTTTVSGINVRGPRDFRAREVRLSDIVAGLSKICRYNGQIDRFYSVAEHSVLVSRFAYYVGDADAIVPALFHDAHEAYSGDYPSPQKGMVPELRPFERGYAEVVRGALGLPVDSDRVWERVRDYDTRILHRELRNLRKILPDWYDPQVEATVPNEIQPLGVEWRDAERMFRTCIQDLGIAL